MSIPDDVARQIVHGTPRGYELGCKTQGGCANHGHRTLMTCADAAKALRGDWELRKLPADQPFEKKVRRLARPAKPSTAAAAPQVTRDARRKPTAREPKPITHGTVWGYMQGCTDPETCPNHDSAEVLTCSDARRKYRADYAARRLAGEGREIVHGTTAGYTLGCHDREACPGDENSLTCADAERLADQERRRKRGVQPAPELTDSGPARAHLLAMQQAGLSLMKIVRLTGVSKTAIRCLISGRDDYVNGEKGPRHGEIPARITTDKAARILAVEISKVAA